MHQCIEGLDGYVWVVLYTRRGLVGVPRAVGGGGM